ncbi:MAG: carboxy-S-adenosyl-L-methionine synthase CmoA [Methylomonas sp.]|jgi:tRNA (cmo5U34)-methyltransferase|uniref:carboxy-S-adenosyl-L-methionine synthase CmoA n=1 Tax=Methylomonas sp. TaxID=418 RepID=UPI0025CBF8C8|nr:carboxy-S-adenosyl-L-methionine synthase CmoA [Methylomonas sp.]MCK9609108.1 carboxy-S-adenosyl-L-methionine synthase CmoA [Methylomonas sp.]
MQSDKDSLYANPLGEITTFKFDDSVVNVFPDMIQRSVPGYSAIISAIGLLAGRFSQPHSHCYDLGCSLGAATLAMREQITATDCGIVAVDNSESMVERFKLNLVADQSKASIDIQCADIRAVSIEQASVVVLNFTLQFVPVADRVALLEKIYQGMLPGGVLILSEKLAFEDRRQQGLHVDMHHHFKKMQGYSELEISQKRMALENVLLAESFAVHRHRLKAAGFDSVEIWFQYFNFASMIALK